ncbi:hypothetical protein KXW98_006991 [Aspergillus fumigatus]|uniref:Uncharacterized protein n=3 Tax=Aspergillus fumigatus TaxID=746128 RepID=Q4WHL7_ASPFU|nr:conserved hypothetical protein [Aspergillus fumigatus Af293]EDP54146.1 conserved hypothetical protein [Aspergillus fumigatus A1163]KAF4283970.1 hypothetical protein CNMCM8689_006679 [Aspergillus fumigatus]EAL87588.1 conserved hypothetical protein [Aspergillus fumigatus Af293]KAF4293891.1 hypothetical protein CNMCM8686_005074 [Aspergillus fumigatus]KAH1275986.1 hypothetical protein KXX45_005708 [Aspergillus fumigatus]
MDISQETVDKIRRFAQKRQKAEEFYEEHSVNPANFDAYNRKLDETLAELQAQVKRHEDELRKLRMTTTIEFAQIGADPWARISEVRRAKKAYDSLLQSETRLPSPGSPLPSLLAVDEASRLVKESKTSISLTAEKLSADRQRLKAEEANLRDAQLIKDGLEKRIERLNAEKSSQVQKTPAQLAYDLVKEQQEKIERLDTTTEELKSSLYKFVEDTLAPMLAAENLGGPTVGDALEISDTTLKAGYTSHGKPKKPKTPAVGTSDSGQQRIDELVRRQTAQEGNEQATLLNKREAAAAEMRALLTALLDADYSYVDLPHESAASRFLVRAKVAQFHPRDARKLRLIDFGRSLVD